MPDCGFLTVSSSKRPAAFVCSQVVKALKGATSAASSTDGLRNRLCKVAQKPRGGGQSVAVEEIG